jgi:hypothetical protein
VPGAVGLLQRRIGVVGHQHAQAIQIVRGQRLFPVHHDLPPGGVDGHPGRQLHLGHPRTVIEPQLEAGGDARRVQVAVVPGLLPAPVVEPQRQVGGAQHLPLEEARTFDRVAHLSSPAS